MLLILPWFCHREPFQTGFCVLSMYLYHSLSFLCFWHQRCSQLIMYFPRFSPRFGRFSKERWFLLVENNIHTPTCTFTFTFIYTYIYWKWWAHNGTSSFDTTKRQPDFFSFLILNLLSDKKNLKSFYSKYMCFLFKPHVYNQSPI